MEILVILLAELLTPIIIPAGMGAIALLCFLIELPFVLLEMILTLIIEGSFAAWKKRRLTPNTENAETAIPIETVQGKRKRKLVFRIAQWGAGICAAILLFLRLCPFFFENGSRLSCRLLTNLCFGIFW